MKRLSAILAATAWLAPSLAPVAFLSAEQERGIVTDNVVQLEQTISPEGFVHPGISCNAETLSVMREMVLSGVSPWVDYFEGLRRTRFANLDQRPRLVGRIVNDGGIGAFAQDAHLAWGHTILYLVTGDEAYRQTPVEIINWYGSRTEESFFPRYFSDSHIKIGKYVYTLASAADILRHTTPNDESLAVTADMIDNLQTYCFMPIRENSIQNNTYFMNQHSYAIMGYLASAIMADEVEGYNEVVEWTTVNADTPNWGRSGSIKHQIRMVTRNDKTGESVEPNLQVVEMGRDQPHAGGNTDNLLMMAKTIDFQQTKVDPVAGTVTDAENGVSPIHFLDDRLIKGATLFAKYNLGYGLPWVSTFSETDPNHQDYGARYDQISPAQRGRLGGNGTPAAYYYYKGIGFDTDDGPYQYLGKARQAFDVAQERRARSGQYIDSVHNYAFDFWIGLPRTASTASPDPEKAKRALAVDLPPLTIERDGAEVTGTQFEYAFADLSDGAMPGDIYPGSPTDIPLEVERDADGTGYVRMTLDQDPRSMVAFVSLSRGAGLRIRSNSVVELNFFSNEDYERRGSLQTIYLPDTGDGWKYVTTTFNLPDIIYIEATPLDGPATVDFDRIDTDPEIVSPITYSVSREARSIPTYVGAKIEREFAAVSDRESLRYSVRDLPADASFDQTSGRLTWTPASGQTGDHTIYITAGTSVSVNTIPVHIHVAADLESALNHVAEAYDPEEKYVSATEEAFHAALRARDLAALKEAADGLELLTPRLADGSLDYRKTWSYDILGSRHMADFDPMTWGGLWGFDKNITMDFGNDFKVRADSFGIQARDGFPIRVAEAVVYGSNDNTNWILLTENAAVASPDMQTLHVKEEQREKAYRYLRFFMPAKPFPIFEISELRIFGERIEDYSPDYHVAFIKAYEDGTFRPDQNLTRAEAASLLAGVVNDYTDKGAYDCEYTDVSRSAWYYDDVAYMSRKGFIAADDDNRFRPEEEITRAEFAGFLALMNERHGDGDRRHRFSDVTTDTPNVAAIGSVTEEGWLGGFADGTFRPGAPVTRAEFVVAVNRMLEREYGEDIPGARPFPDVDKSHPAYSDIMGASHTHPVD